MLNTKKVKREEIKRIHLSIDEYKIEWPLCVDRRQGTMQDFVQTFDPEGELLLLIERDNTQEVDR